MKLKHLCKNSVTTSFRPSCMARAPRYRHFSAENGRSVTGTDDILPFAKARRLPQIIALALFLVFLCAPPPAQAASALADLIASLETSERYDPDKLAAVYRETVITGAGIDRAVARLRAYARAVTLSPEGQAACHLAIAHLQWRDGAIEDAVISSEQALESSPTSEALLLKARLLDAGGDEDAAREWYERAAAEFGEGDEQWLIRVRLAMMDVSSYNVEVLEELVSQRGQDYRNQAAVVLALLGRPERAIELFEPLEEAGKLFQQHLRLSEWALQAEAHGEARAQAWLAYERASVRADRLYALSLLAESYRIADELDLLLEDLALRDPADQDLLRLRVETLIETEEYHRAIELYRQLEGTEADIAERRRLVALYEAAGDTDAMVDEYRRMMEAEPDQPQWYDGLAAHYLNIADNDAALAVWETLEERNGAGAGVLVEGARLMLAMGFLAESVAMIERHLDGHGPDVGALLFLFETWLDRGRDESALAALERLEAFLPPDALELRDLADAYERLSRPEEALRVFEAIRDTRGELGYDDRMRLAWLYTIVDRKREALDLWRDIWVEVESPARRSFAESQLLLLAAELGALGDMAVELEGMLLSGSANRNHMNLLVRIYTEAGDKLSATEIIDEYALELGEDEVGQQELLAHVYMLLEDYPAHDRALRRLYEIDPVNRSDHIKSIIINLLTYDLATETNERYEEITRWIGELRKFDEESVTGEFEASIYSTAGFADEAVEAYRRALVEQPENSDNLLLLADVMDSNNRTGEAVAILQFFAENAVEDNDFVVAVDGILNLVGTTTFFQQPDPETLDTLAWTRRVILERIAGRANKFYLYELLADIAREQGDTEASFIALENSLAESGLRRPAVLRELLTMATPNAGFSGFSTGAGDIDRQLQYGRRLVGLRQQLPPEVYIDVGKSLLAKEDVAGAERAFEMIDDITGMIEIDRTKAEIFEEAGYDEQSRVFYNRALNVNRDSLELLHKTGFLYEVIGREDVAFRRYLKAIGDVLRRQSTVLAAGARPVDPNSWQAIMNQRTDTTVSREYREHYASLEQGLLLSWPEETAESEAAAAELKALFDTELRNVLDRSGEELLPLARYARLDRTARLIRQVGFFLGDDELARYADRKLLDHFGDDGDFAGHLVQAYGSAGRPLPDGVDPDEAGSALAALSPLRRQLALAEEREDFETQLQLLRLDGAFDEMETLLGERILDGNFREGLGYALGLLGKSEFSRLALASMMAVDKPDLLRLVGSSPQIVLKAEEAIGRPLLSAGEVIALLQATDAHAESPDQLADPSGLWEYLKVRGKASDRLRFFKVLPRHEFFSELLQENLTEAQQDGIAKRVVAELSDLREGLSKSTKRKVLSFMPLHALPENREVLLRIGEYAERRWPDLTGTKQLMNATYEGRRGEAFLRLVELAGELLEEDVIPRLGFFPGFHEVLDEPRLRILSEIASGQSVDSKLARAAFAIDFPPLRYRNATRNELEGMLPLLENLHRLEPEDKLLHVHFIRTLVTLGRLNGARKRIAAEYSANADERNWRLAYFLVLRAQQRFQEALAVATDGGADLCDSHTLAKLVNEHRRPSKGAFGDVVVRLFQLGNRVVDRGSSKKRFRRLNAALITGDHQVGQQALRKVWRQLLAPGNSSYARAADSRPFHSKASFLLNSRLSISIQNDAASPVIGAMGFSVSNPWLSVSRPRPRELLDAVAHTPYGADELEGYLRAMPNNSRKGFHPLYRHLATALDGGPRLGELWLRLQEQEIDDHEFTLWMLLRDRQEKGFAVGELGAFEKRFAAMPNPAPFQLLLAARVFATAGVVEQAVQQYKLFAARRIQHNEFAGRERVSAIGTIEDSGVAGLLDLIDEICARLPHSVARAIVYDILSLARRADSLPGADALFDALVLASLGKLYPPQELLREVTLAFPGILAPTREATSAGAAKTAELIRAYARSGDPDRAIKLLRSFVMQVPQRRRGTGNPQRYRTESAMRSVSSLYGIRLSANSSFLLDKEAAGVQEILERQGRLFPDAVNDWPAMDQWINAMEDNLLGWLADGHAGRQDTLALLTALGMRRVRLGERGKAAELLTHISDRIEPAGQPLNARELVLLGNLAHSSDTSLRFELVAGAFKGGELSWRDELALVSLFVNSTKRTKMLRLVRELDIDYGLEMMRLLQLMAERAGEMDYARDLQQRIELEESAERKFFPDEGHLAHSTVMAVPKFSPSRRATARSMPVPVRTVSR